MNRRRATVFAPILFALCLPLAARGQEPHAKKLPPFELLDGDRVALVGNAFLEREQKYSYLETLLAILRRS